MSTKRKKAPNGAGNIIASGHRQIMRNGRRYLQHRKVFEDEVGPIPRGWVIHHIDLDPSNNSVDNLLAVTHSFHRWLYYREEIVAEAMETEEHFPWGWEWWPIEAWVTLPRETATEVEKLAADAGVTSRTMRALLELSGVMFDTFHSEEARLLAASTTA